MKKKIHFVIGHDLEKFFLQLHGKSFFSCEITFFLKCFKTKRNIGIISIKHQPILKIKSFSYFLDYENSMETVSI